MIPRIIHYCWFGRNEKPELAEKCISSWRQHCPDYEIIEWNEDNFDVSVSPSYVRQAYEAKKWAFVTDYVRLKVVYDYGGVYFDTDVELLGTIDQLLNEHAFFGFEEGGKIATGLGFGAESGASIIAEMMLEYDTMDFSTQLDSNMLIPCPVINTRVLLRHGLRQVDSEQWLDGKIRILSSSVLCPIKYSTGERNIMKETLAIHWFAASWQSKKSKQLHEKARFLSRLLGEKAAWILLGVTSGIQREGLFRYIAARIKRH